MNKTKLTFNELMQLVDLTCLRDNVTQQDIVSLTYQAEQFNVAAICVWSKHLNWIPTSCKIQKATVVNFPHGSKNASTVQKEIDEVLYKLSNTEIDYVFPYNEYWSGNKNEALAHCKAIQKHCCSYGVKLKVILETGAQFDTAAIQELAQRVIDLDVHMLKTSTGKISVGATPAAVEAICIAIKNSNSTCGIKISGGVKTYNQALEYLNIIENHITNAPAKSWLRFGASQLINDGQLN